LKVLKIYFPVFILALLSLSFTKSEWKVLSAKEANTKFAELNSKINELSSFTVSVSHRTFENYETTKWAFQYDGYVKKQGNNYHSLLMGLHTIQNEKYKLVMDTSKHIILVSLPSEQVDLGNYTAQNEKLMSACKEIKMKTEPEKTIFHFVFNEMMMYSKSELSFNKELLPLSIKIYLNKQVKVKKDGVEKLDKPRVEVNYTNYIKNVKFSANEFSEKKYFREVNSSFIPAEAYKDYTIKDLRLKTSK
jgi:hypothetical protein